MIPVNEPLIGAKEIEYVNECLRTGLDAVQFAQKLKEKGVETRPFFLGMHEQPVFNGMGLFQKEKYPVAERIARQGLYLPSGLTLTETQIDVVCDKVKSSLEHGLA